MRHELKCWPGFFNSVVDRTKNFELRKDDRGFRVGDTLVLMEYESTPERLTGRSRTRRIKYVLKNYNGLQDGYCILGF